MKPRWKCNKIAYGRGKRKNFSLCFEYISEGIRLKGRKTEIKQTLICCCCCCCCFCLQLHSPMFLQLRLSEQRQLMDDRVKDATISQETCRNTISEHLYVSNRIAAVVFSFKSCMMLGVIVAICIQFFGISLLEAIEWLTSTNVPGFGLWKSTRWPSEWWENGHPCHVDSFSYEKKNTSCINHAAYTSYRYYIYIYITVFSIHIMILLWWYWYMTCIINVSDIYFDAVFRYPLPLGFFVRDRLSDTEASGALKTMGFLVSWNFCRIATLLHIPRCHLTYVW